MTQTVQGSMFKVQFKNTENSRKLIAFYLDALRTVAIRLC